VRRALIPVLAIVTVLAFLQGCQRARHEQKCTLEHPCDVTIGDVTLKMLRHVHLGSHEDGVVIYPDRDVRFHYENSLKGLRIFVQTLRPQDMKIKAPDPRTLVPDRSLYPAAPSSMKVFALPTGGRTMALIFGDDLTVLGKPVFVRCNLGSKIPTGRREQPFRLSNLCYAQGNLTSKVKVTVIFSDDRFPPNEWRTLFNALGTGLEAVVVQ